MGIDPTRTGPSAAAGLPPSRDWYGLLRATAVVTFALLVLAAMVLRDVEAAAVAAVVAVGFGLLHVRRGLAGQVVLALMFTNVLFWMFLGAASNLMGGDGFVAQLFPAALTASTATGLAAVFAVLAGRRGREPSQKAPLRAAIGGSQLLIALLLAGALTGGWDGQPAEDVDVAVVAQHITFTPDTLTAEAGDIALSVANRDLFWHTFTIDELDVNLNVPVNGERRTVFDAAPGTYDIVCRIPGHEGAGMVATLEVR